MMKWVGMSFSKISKPSLFLLVLVTEHEDFCLPKHIITETESGRFPLIIFFHVFLGIMTLLLSWNKDERFLVILSYFPDSFALVI